MAQRTKEPGSSEWNLEQIMLYQSQDATCTNAACVSLKKDGETFSAVRNVAVIPIPIGKGGVYKDGASTFSQWEIGSPSEGEPCSGLSGILRAVYLLTVFSLEQPGIGTEAFNKAQVLKHKCWATFQHSIRNPTGTLKKGVLAFNAQGGTFVFDVDVAEHIEYLLRETKDIFPPKKTKTKGRRGRKKTRNADENGEDGEQEEEEETPEEAFERLLSNLPPPPVPERPDGFVKRMKHAILMQPCRSSTDPEKINGFLMWILQIDPNHNLDQAR